MLLPILFIKILIWLIDQNNSIPKAERVNTFPNHPLEHPTPCIITIVTWKGRRNDDNDVAPQYEQWPRLFLEPGKKVEKVQARTPKPATINETSWRTNR